MKRIISLFLALVLVFALVGCGKEKRKIIELTLSTEDSEAIMAAAGIMLPDVEETAPPTPPSSGSRGGIPSTTTGMMRL